jgi:hypothetical protein
MATCSAFDKKTNNIYFGGFTSGPSYPVKNFPNKYSGGADIIMNKVSFDGKLIWATIIGSSSSEYVRACALDSNGNVWVAGDGYPGDDFPVTSNAFQKIYKGGPTEGELVNFSSDGYVLYSTLFGGNGRDVLTNLCVDKENTIWGVGRTNARDFPITSDAQKRFIIEDFESLLYRFSTDGKLLYSSYFGGNSSGAWTLADGITTNRDGDIIIAGYTNSESLPVTSNAFQTNYSAGRDSYITSFHPDGKIAWCTYVGGTSIEYGCNITIDGNDNVYVQHYTNSTNLPRINSTLQTTNSGGLDNYITKFDKNGNIKWATYFGGAGNEGEDLGGWDYIGGGLCTTPKNNLAVFFKTTSPNLKTSTDAIQSNISGNYDPYILLLDSNSNFLGGTYFGGSSTENTANILAYSDSILIISGSTSSNNFPVKNPIQSTRKGESDQFMAVLGVSALPAPPPPPTDSIPPTITGVQDSCNLFRIISVKDDQISTSGLKDINIIQSDNCDISITNKTQTTATILIRLIDYEKNGYYTIEIIDNAGNKTIIKDMLHSTESNYISFTPRPLYDFGKVKFGQTICKDMMIHNSSAKDVEIKDIMIAKNLDFSIPQSQYPIVVPALDSVSIHVCFSAKYPLYGMYRDTLTYFENCVFAQTALVAEIDSAAYDGISRCEVVIKIRSNYDSLGDSEPLIYPNPTRGIVWINSNNSRDDLSLEVYNILGEQVKSMQIGAKSLPMQIDLRDMNDGNYVIIIHQNNLLSVKKILLLQ